MKAIFTLTTLIGFASASPIPAPKPSEPLPLISLSLIGSPSHYTTGSSQSPQSHTSSNAWSIHIPIDISFDLSARPTHVQAIEVIGVEPGMDLEDGKIGKNDIDVLCKATMGRGDESVIVRMGGPRVVVDGGKMGKVTGVSCWKDRA